MKIEKSIEAARSAVEHAESEHAREAERAAAAEREAERLGEELQAADPDAPAFAKLIAQRSTVAARVEALEQRAMRAELALQQAQEALAEAEAADRRVRAAALDAQLRALDATIAGEVAKFYGQLLQRIAEARAIVAEANELDRPPPGGDLQRGSRWAATPANKAAFRQAQNILPDEPAGERPPEVRP